MHCSNCYELQMEIIRLQVVQMKLSGFSIRQKCVHHLFLRTSNNKQIFMILLSSLSGLFLSKVIIEMRTAKVSVQIKMQYSKSRSLILCIKIQFLVKGISWIIIMYIRWRHWFLICRKVSALCIYMKIRFSCEFTFMREVITDS
jgi:hypothetical protein